MLSYSKSQFYKDLNKKCFGTTSLYDKNMFSPHVKNANNKKQKMLIKRSKKQQELVTLLQKQSICFTPSEGKQSIFMGLAIFGNTSFETTSGESMIRTIQSAYIF